MEGNLNGKLATQLQDSVEGNSNGYQMMTLVTCYILEGFHLNSRKYVFCLTEHISNWPKIPRFHRKYFNPGTGSQKGKYFILVWRCAPQ